MTLNAEAKAASSKFSPIVELRQYTLHPGKRDALIDIFDGHLVDGQEEAGMTIVGQFRDLDDGQKFVWLRGFDDMKARKTALSAFYGGPVWETHRDAANETMISSDDVLLLAPAWPGSAFDLAGATRRPLGAAQADAVTTAMIFHIEPADEPDFVALFQREAAPLLAGLGAPVIAAFVTEHAENSFPRLPVRADENVFIAFSALENANALGQHQGALATEPSWANDLFPRLQRHFSKPMERLRLLPTSRSML